MPARLVLTLVLALLTALPGAAGAVPRGQNFGTPLSGDEEVPPRDTRARGEATFHLSADESTIEYRLIVSNIDNVVAAHIHCAPAGVNGPVIQLLFGPAAPGGGRTSGILAEGSFSPPGGPCAGVGFLDAMRSGLTYVNVHTNDGVGPIDTGSGDFPGGEIRGQIEARGPNL
ncbi:MAG: CHRD domain-containing protein [Actinomycetota bacterium]